MDEELVRHIVKTAFKSASEFTDLYSLINEFCEDEGLKENLKSSLQKIIADIGYEFNKQITDVYPIIQEEINGSIEKYGFLIRQ